MLPASFLLVQCTGETNQGPMSMISSLFSNMATHPHILCFRAMIDSFKKKFHGHAYNLKKKGVEITTQLKEKTHKHFDDTVEKIKQQYQNIKNKYSQTSEEIVEPENTQDDEQQLKELLLKLAQSFAEQEKILQEEMKNQQNVSQENREQQSLDAAQYQQQDITDQKDEEKREKKEL